MSKIYKSITELIGKTPLLELCNIKKKLSLRANIIAKLEFCNPAGSVKDRVALNMIKEAKEKGCLTADSVIIEPTSGNTGIGIAAVCSALGYRAIIVMPDTMSKERRLLMSAYGAEVVLSDGKYGMAGAIKKAESLSKEIPNSIIAGQFVNGANPRAHAQTTGPEIYNDTDGNIDIFVAGVGTGGTITGAGKFLKEKKPSIKIVAVEPKSSAVLSGENAGAHKIQGIGAGFIPEVLETDIYDEIFAVSDEDAIKSSRMLAKTEGVLTGFSGGAALFCAIELAKKSENEGKNIVVLLPDTGDRYLSTELFD